MYTEEEVVKSLNIIMEYCKDRKNRHATCLGCPVRKNYGTRQPECCKLNNIERPCDIDK